MKKTVMAMIVVVFMLALISGAHAATTQTSFRCGNLFVEPGTQSIAVIKYCGEPYVKEDLGFRGRGVGKKIEKWVYGPQSGYYTIIRIEGGVVVNVESVRAD